MSSSIHIEPTRDGLIEQQIAAADKTALVEGGKVTLQEMIDTVDNEAYRLHASARLIAACGVDGDITARARHRVVYDALKRLLEKIKANDKAVARAIRGDGETEAR